MNAWDYVKGLFENHIFVILGVIWATISSFLFPEECYLTSAGAVLGMMALDLVTKLYSLARINHGLRKAIRRRSINSCAFYKGTTDKLLVFGVMLVICGFAYRISPISSLSTWFMQIVFTLMFLRDVLSIIENLMDAGVGGLALFKKVVKKKISAFRIQHISICCRDGKYYWTIKSCGFDSLEEAVADARTRLWS